MSAVIDSPDSLDPESIEWKVARALAVLAQLLRTGAPICVSFSAGKDSSTTLNLLLTAAANLRRQGVALPPIIITHADTGIENPSMVSYARREMQLVLAFARKHDLNVHVEIAHPNLTETWAVRIIGGSSIGRVSTGG